MQASRSRSDTSVPAPGAWYRAAWRWHFYAGVAVAPLLLVLAASGLVMLLGTPLERVLYRELLVVDPGTLPKSAAAQLDAVRAAFPHMLPTLYVPPTDRDRSSEFSLVSAHGGGAGHGHGASTISVFVDPYTARILGTLDRARTPYGWANAVHGTLLLGNVGDAIIESAAGFAVLLVVSGLYLAWPRHQSWRAALLPGRSLTGRVRTRSQHGAIGLWIALPLLFFLVSGLTWTDVWGGRLVQAWNTVTLERSPTASGETPVHSREHAELNRGPLDEVPWALEQTPLPEPGSAGLAPATGANPDLDHILAIAREAGFARFRVALPQDDSGIWTVSASTLAGDIDAPADERFLHIDPHTGNVLADIRYADYSVVARFMASGVPFHQGELGIWNLLFNATLCVTVILLVVLATALWWQRRPTGLLPVAPPAPDPRTGRRVLAAMFVAALFFPLTAAAVALVIVMDRLIMTIRLRLAARARS